MEEFSINPIFIYDVHLFLNGFYNSINENINYKIGNGFDIVKLINKLPFQFHLPGHNYTGPGTNLELNIEKEKKPTNKLDSNAMTHDIKYNEYKDLESRHDADKVLGDSAMEIVKNNDSSLKEKAEGLFVNGMMNVKRMVGMGVGSSINGDNGVGIGDEDIHGIEVDRGKEVEERFKKFLKDNKNKDNVRNITVPIKNEKLTNKQMLILNLICETFGYKNNYLDKKKN